MTKVSVIGSGSWGTALAMVLADNNYSVWMHTINKQIAEDITNNKRNSKYLPDIELPENINCSTSYRQVLEDSQLVLIVVPSHAMRKTAQDISTYIEKDAIVVHATKGIENETLKTMSELLKQELPSHLGNRIVVLSGPSHAEEVSKRIPTTVVSSCTDIGVAQLIQKVFSNQYFRVYANDDVVGVELGGALKNIIALGAGLCDGLGFGDNGKAALLTRGLAEITRLGTELGAKQQTFAGLAGIGDLIVTGTSKHSRNWRTGHMLSQGIGLEEALNKLGMVAEGVKTTKAAYALAQKANVDTPIINELYKILFEDKNPKLAAEELMTRMHKNE